MKTYGQRYVTNVHGSLISNNLKLQTTQQLINCYPSVHPCVCVCVCVCFVCACIVYIIVTDAKSIDSSQVN
jgi:hypothetical protein